jgi:hypothetical protein
MRTIFKLVSVIIFSIVFLSCNTGTDSSPYSSSDPQRIGNKNTKVFHTVDCRFVSEIVNQVNFNSRDEAIRCWLQS